MFAILWRYQVHQDRRADFEATYCASGNWARLFERHLGFRNTQLLRGENGSYVTLDVWRAREDFQSFLRSMKALIPRWNSEPKAGQRWKSGWASSSVD